MPVVNCRAALIDTTGGAKKDQNVYNCPVYKTETRGNTYVFTAQLKTKQPPAKWTLAGVACIFDVEGVSDAYAPGKEIGINWASKEQQNYVEIATSIVFINVFFKNIIKNLYSIL